MVDILFEVHQEGDDVAVVRRNVISMCMVKNELRHSRRIYRTVYGVVAVVVDGGAASLVWFAA